jgi:hypothetical protein
MPNLEWPYVRRSEACASVHPGPALVALDRIIDRVCPAPSELSTRVE